LVHTTQHKAKQINVRENRRAYQEWTIQRHWQHWAHTTQDKAKQINVRENPFDFEHTR
jgi:hypothetical protein